jgi:hypothetical protein
VSKKAVRPYVKDNFHTRSLQLSQYTNEIPNEVKTRLAELERHGACAVLVLAGLDSLGSMKSNVLMQTKSVLSQLPGAKLVAFPNLAVGEQKTVRKKEEADLDALGADEEADAADGPGEDAFDAILDPLAVEGLDEIPMVAADGGTKLTKHQRLSRLGQDRESCRQTLAAIGGSAFKHFMLGCTLHWDGPTRLNFQSTECVVLVPMAPDTKHNWVTNSVLMEGGVARLAVAQEFVRISKLAAEAVALKGGLEVEMTKEYRHRASRMQKDVQSCKEIFTKTFRKMEKNIKSVMLVNLFGMSQDWGVGFMEWSLGSNLKSLYLSFDYKEEYNVVGSARIMQRAMELFHENRLVIPGSEPVGAFKPSSTLKTHADAVAEINNKMKFLKVSADGTLIVPSLEKLAEAMGSTTESLRLHKADIILQEARQMKASLQPLREVSYKELKAPEEKETSLVDSSTLQDAFKIVGRCELEGNMVCLGLANGAERRLGVQHAANASLFISSGTLLGCCGAMKIIVADEFEAEACKPSFEYALGSGQRFVPQDSTQVASVPEYLNGKGINLATVDKSYLVYGQKSVLNINGDLQCFPSTKCILVAESDFKATEDDTGADRIGLFAGPLGKASLAKRLPILFFCETPSPTATSQYYLAPTGVTKLCVVTAQDIEVPTGKTLIL